MAMCVSARNMRVSVVDGSDCSLLRFVSENYVDGREAYDFCRLLMLPLSNHTSAYCVSSMTVTVAYAYISDTGTLKIGDNVMYHGEPVAHTLLSERVDQRRHGDHIRGQGDGALAGDQSRENGIGWRTFIILV
jgi:hypothetical protein